MSELEQAREMLTFNDMLQLAGLDLREVRLLRHHEPARPTGQTPFVIWRSDPSAFDAYNAIMKKNRFGKSKLTAAFVVTPAREVVFTRIYRVNGFGEVPLGTICPVANETRHGLQDVVFYDVERTDILAEYEGRIVIDWGSGALAWAQHADRNQKPILEIRASFKEPELPGWRSFGCNVADLNSLPDTWQAILRSVSGVYLLVHKESGRQYVGSAYGSDGLWGRWQNYRATGHGGNVELKSLGLKAEDPHITVLETTPSNATRDDVIQTENSWKEKLGSRVIGLNAN